MLNTEYVVIDFEGFKHKTGEYILKEISVFGPSYQDTLLLRPPYDLKIVPAETRKTYLWVSKHLHGLDWNVGTHDYPFLHTFFNSLKLRFPASVFYAKGPSKCNFLRSHLFRVVDLESVGCPKITQFPQYQNNICSNHIHSQYYFYHCSKKKAYLFYIWLTNKINENGFTFLQNTNSANAPIVEPIPTNDVHDPTNGSEG